MRDQAEMATVERKDRRGARPLVAVLAALALCWAFAALVSVSAYSATGDVANLGKLEKRQLTGFRFGKPEETEEGDDDSALTGERSLVDWTPYAGSSGKRPRLPVNIKKRTTKRRRRTTRKKLGAGKTTSKRWTTSKRRTTSRRLAGPAATSRAPVKTTARPASVCPVYPVATDGMCGTATGKKCPSPYCCSSTGFCGLGDAWCGTGCQLGFGNCNAGTGCGPSNPVAATTARPAAMTTANPVSPPSPPPPAPPAEPSDCPIYPVTNDGMCGELYGKRCPFGQCCSKGGFCGIGDAWCGTGCQNGYGTCNTGGCFPVPETPGGGGSNPTTTKAIPPGTPTATRTRTPRTTIPIDYSKVPRYAVQKELGSYFSQWGVYSRGFKVGKITKMTSANEITFINYAFGNIYKRNGGYECGIVNSMESGDGSGGDGYSDFGMSYNAADSVDGIADTWDQPLAGNFNQLKKLKRKYPNLRAFISIGGWTWSKWFSEAAATDDSRRQLVESCIDVYIKGNLPVIDGRGGPGSGAGVFDGIDIDWEYPGGGGLGYNTFSPADKQSFSLLLQEFRYQLSLLSLSTGKPYGLTVAIGAGRDKVMSTEPAVYSKYLDWINVMSYDFRGAWDSTGPTNFHANMIGDPKTPDFNKPKTGILPGANRYYNVKDSIDYLIAQGAPANKLVLGIPFYGRGWTGVKPGLNGTGGLYQNATGPARGTYEPGIEDYKVLKTAPGKLYFHNITQTSYKYEATSGTWWSYDTPADVDRKVAYAKNMGMRGVFSWSLDGDTTEGELLSRCVLVKR